MPRLREHGSYALFYWNAIVKSPETIQFQPVLKQRMHSYDRLRIGIEEPQIDPQFW
jgi:hypothetical protein